jgi:hypothetical protein
MSSLTTQFVTDLLNHYFTNATHPNIGGGIPASSQSGNLYVALHSSAPTDGGYQSTGELSYDNYQRVAVPRSSAGFSVSGKNVSPAAGVTFPKCGTGTATAYFWSIGTDGNKANQGYLILRGAIGLAPSPFVAGSGAPINCPNAAFAVNDPVVFWQYEDSALPGGIVEGTVYWVLTVVSGTFTISASQGGAAVSITSAGQGTCQKLTPLNISANVTPKLDATTIIKFQ